MELSIIIPSTRTQLLEKLLRSIVNAKTKELSLQVIVVFDGAVEDRADFLQLLKKYSRFILLHHFITEGFIGPTKARNLGWKMAKHEQLLFLDDDVHLAPDFFQALSKYALKPDEAYLANVRHCADLYVSKEAQEMRATWLNLPDKLENSEDLALLNWREMQTCSLLINKKVVQALKGFNEAYSQAHYDDLEFALRFHQGAFQLKFLKQCTAYHFSFKNIKNYIKWSYKNGYWKKKFVEQFPEVFEEATQIVRNGMQVNLLEVPTLSKKDKLHQLKLLYKLQEVKGEDIHKDFNRQLIQLGVSFEAEAFQSN